MENRRKSKRVSSNLVVIFRVKSSRLASGSRIKDISGTGVCIPLNHYFPVGSLIELEMRAYHLKGPIKASARIVRTSIQENSMSKFEMGIEFIDFPAAHRNRLNEYIHQAMLQVSELN